VNLVDCFGQPPISTKFNNYASHQRKCFCSTDELCGVFNAHCATKGNLGSNDFDGDTNGSVYGTCQIYHKLPRCTGRFFNSRQIRLVILGNSNLSHGAQPGSCFGEISCDRFIGKNEQSLDRLITLFYRVKCKLLFHNNDELLEYENVSFARR
jgi:hypothetical protein